jgi:osmoprotectant transport system permease protein
MERVKGSEKRKLLYGLIYIAVIFGFFLFLITNMGIWQKALSMLFPAETEVIYPRANLLELLKEHILLVLASSVAATFAGVCVGLFVTRPIGRDFLGVVNDLSSLAQTIPPVAVLALAVPFIGFGFKPTVLALFLYSILPIIRNTISGLESVSPLLIEAAYGMGMKRGQILFRVELPLSLKVIMAGVRTSVVINVGTATVGAVVGAGGLGTPIISGLVRENPAFVLEGALSAALLAFLLDQIIAKTEIYLFQAYGRQEKES